MPITTTLFYFFGLTAWIGPSVRCQIEMVKTDTLSPNFKGYVTLVRECFQLSRSVVSNSLRPHEPQHARPPCPSPTPGVYPNSCPLSQWCHPTISSSVIPFSSCSQSFPASGSFPMSQLFASVGQSIGVTASTSVLPMLGEIKWINTCKACWTRLTYVVVQSLGLVQLFATPWTAAHLASLSFTLSQSLLRLMSIQLVRDAIQSSHPLLSPSPPALNLFQHQDLFKWVSPSHQVAKVLEFQLQYQSFQLLSSKRLMCWYMLQHGWLLKIL